MTTKTKRADMQVCHYKITTAKMAVLYKEGKCDSPLHKGKEGRDIESFEF